MRLVPDLFRVLQKNISLVKRAIRWANATRLCINDYVLLGAFCTVFHGLGKILERLLSAVRTKHIVFGVRVQWCRGHPN
jgi:hypothetical protein